MYNTSIIRIRPLGFQWETSDPFLFCVHHLDDYPAGNAELGPAASLTGRNLGQDFTLKDGWRMYHGLTVPGFPAHPHRGFETVTVVLKGFVDHSDSHGAAGRYGNGDVQWMTAGSGLQHAEMFPLLKGEERNQLELYQIWINLPQSKKMADPYYTMLWNEEIPEVSVSDEEGRVTTLRLIAGVLNGVVPPPPAPDSWAADPGNEVAIWTINMEAGAKWALPPAVNPVNRTLYFNTGASLKVSGVEVQPYHAIELFPGQTTTLENGSAPSKLLMLQGRPIHEPVVQYGPFVMNTEQEIYQAFTDFRETQFGGWPWQRTDPVHSPAKGRFATFADGSSIEK